MTTINGITAWLWPYTPWADRQDSRRRLTSYVSAGATRDRPLLLKFTHGQVDADAAFGWLDKAVEQETFAAIRQYASPFFRSLHTDPRCRKLLERVGRSPKQLAAVEFNVTLPPGVNVEE